MKITLRQHKDGSYVLLVRNKEVRKEFDITNIIRDIFLTKLNDLQTRVRLETKYRNWMVGHSHKSQGTLASTRSRYEAISKRLKYTDGAIEDLVQEWKEEEIKGHTVRELIKVKSQNEYFLENDDTLRKIDESL